jgi:N-acetyl-gamma-glutamyl-phosphate reductase
MINVAIIGATGYTGFESIQLLLRHPHAQVACLTAREDKCGPVSSIFPSLQGLLDIEMGTFDPKTVTAKADVAFSCLPHKESMAVVPRLLEAGLKVVDFSADYRLHDVSLYESAYQVPHTDGENLARAAFGLPELFRESIRGAQLVANPGCYPTAASLALAPLLKNKLIDPQDIVVNAVSGVSGAGRKPQQPFHFPEMSENLFGYGVGNHRHQPEIEQILSEHSGQATSVLFQPHVVNINRGINETIYARPVNAINQEALTALYHETYADEPFVRIVDVPTTMRNVAHTNFCDIFPTMAKGKIVLFAAIDNLIKGAAGQAMQNMNLICDRPETEGLL